MVSMLHDAVQHLARLRGLDSTAQSTVFKPGHWPRRTEQEPATEEWTMQQSDVQVP